MLSLAMHCKAISLTFRLFGDDWESRCSLWNGYSHAARKQEIQLSVSLGEDVWAFPIQKWDDLQPSDDGEAAEL